MHIIILTISHCKWDNDFTAFARFLVTLLDIAGNCITKLYFKMFQKCVVLSMICACFFTRILARKAISSDKYNGKTNIVLVVCFIEAISTDSITKRKNILCGTE